MAHRKEPGQQLQPIKERIQRNGFPWKLVQVYEEEPMSGRYVRKRSRFQQLLRDIENKVLVIDLIVVDTFERLGRAEEVSRIREKLFNEHGVLVVTADTNFADPTGVVGKAVGMVENIRSTEDGRIKAHNAVRGKRDTARLKRKSRSEADSPS